MGFAQSPEENVLPAILLHSEVVGLPVGLGEVLRLPVLSWPSTWGRVRVAVEYQPTRKGGA